MASQGTARAASGLRTGLRRPLASRPLDILWIAFFALHLSASLLIDSQAFVPRRLVPAPLSRLLQQYLADSRDPLITAALRRDPSYAWFITALALELCVQCPAFAAGIWGLWKDDARVYPWLIAYAALATTTTLQCLVSVTLGADRSGLSAANMRALLSGYVPFVILPLGLGLDMIRRTARLLEQPSVRDKTL